MSLWNDFWDFVEDTVDDVGDTLSDAWSAVKENPIGTITSAVAMAYGIPPMWAGALGGAAGAAATGGDIVKAAVTGGAMGYMGAAAGAAAGSAGSLAQAAAAGTAASVTGAILTGQDVLTAAKQGLILGTAVYGGQQVYQFMTPQEAINTVPGKSLADLTANSSDPLGDLINEMGWTDSNSARAAASQAFSKNAATTQAMLMESIPDYVLQSASKASNPAAYIAEELGWNQNNLTVGAANKATAQYKAVELQQEQAAAQEASKPINQMASSGVDRNDAQLLVENGYTPNEVQTLINKGYTGAELADMASTGVTSNDLLRVTNTTFTPDQVNQFLQSGGSVNEIVGYDGLVKSNAVNTNDVQTLIENNVSPAAARSLAYSGKLEAAKTLLNNGVSIDNVNSLNQNGWDLNKLANQVENRYISGEDIQNTLANNYTRQGINNLLNDTSRLPTPEEVQLQQQQELQQQQQQAQQQQAQQTIQQQAQALADKSGGYLTAQQVMDEHLSLEDVEFYKNYMDQRLGVNQPVQPEVTNPTEVAGPVTPPESVDVSNITQEQLNQITQENNPYANTNEGTSTAYTTEQQNMYTRLREAGYGVQEAMDMVTNGVATDTTPTRVDVTGTPAFADNPGPAVPHYRTPNTDLATQAQIDSGQASFNQSANAWEVPTTPAQPNPIVPIVVPPTPVTPPVTTPVVQQPAPQPEVPQPVTPPTVAQPTVVSSSTRTAYDGTVTRDDQMSDGTVVSTIISGPTGTGGTTRDAGSYLIGYCSPSGGPAVTPGAPWVDDLDPMSSGADHFHQIVSATGTYSATCTFGSANEWNAAFAAYGAH